MQRHVEVTLTQRLLMFDTHTTGIHSKQKEFGSVAKQFQEDLHPRNQHASCAKGFQMWMHDQGGFIVVVEWYGGTILLSSGVSPVLEALQLRDPDRFFICGLHRNIKAWDEFLRAIPRRNVLAGGFETKCSFLNLFIHFWGVCMSESNILQTCRLQSSFRTMHCAESSRILHLRKLFFVLLQECSGYGGKLVLIIPPTWCCLQP